MGRRERDNSSPMVFVRPLSLKKIALVFTVLSFLE